MTSHDPQARFPISSFSVTHGDGRLTEFIHSKCDIHPAGQVKASDLYNAWKAWCATTGTNPGSQDGFCKAMTAWGAIRGRKANANYYYLISLKEQDAKETQDPDQSQP